MRRVGLFRRSAALSHTVVEADPRSNPALNFDFSGGPIPAGSGVWEKLLPVAFHKRTCFQYKRERRVALYQRSRPNDHGCNINLRLEGIDQRSVCGADEISEFLAKRDAKVRAEARAELIEEMQAENLAVL